MTTHKFEEALAGMRRGEFWRREPWGTSHHLRINADGNVEFVNAAHGSWTAGLHNEDVTASDWVRLQEPRTFLQAITMMRAGKPQQRPGWFNDGDLIIDGGVVVIRVDGRVNAGPWMAHAGDIEATDWQDSPERGEG